MIYRDSKNLVNDESPQNNNIIDIFDTDNTFFSTKPIIV